jgi:uncharacterized protein with HEPN domain
MTLRDREAFLWDMLQAARHIESFIKGKTLQEYEEDDLLRSGVERQFLIIGEAAGQAVRRFPELEDEISSLGRIIAFRNRLVHGYAVISNDVVWAIAHDELPELRGILEPLLEDHLGKNTI